MAWLGALLVAGMLGCEPVVDDGALLSELSTAQFMSLCDELRDAAPEPPAITCSDGWSATIVTPSNLSCRYMYREQCPATAGEMRACAAAVRRDPCAAMDAPPAECAPLEVRECFPEFMASRVTAECPAAEPEALAALEGIYEVVDHTRRGGSCEPGGESVLDLDTQRLAVVVQSQTGLGAPIGLLESCRDVGECRAAAANLREGERGSAFIELELAFRCPEGDPAVYTARVLTFPASAGDECQVIDRVTAVSKAPDGSLRLATETWESTGSRVSDTCSGSSDARRPIAGACTSLELRELRFYMAL